MDQPVDELLFTGGFRRRRMLVPVREPGAHGGAGALERAGHGLLGNPEDLGRFARGEAEHVAQNQDRALARRQRCTAVMKASEIASRFIPGVRPRLAVGEAF
jgi:hypothetical protein